MTRRFAFLLSYNPGIAAAKVFAHLWAAFAIAIVGQEHAISLLLLWAGMWFIFGVVGVVLGRPVFPDDSDPRDRWGSR